MKHISQQKRKTTNLNVRRKKIVRSVNGTNFQDLTNGGVKSPDSGVTEASEGLREVSMILTFLKNTISLLKKKALRVAVRTERQSPVGLFIESSAELAPSPAGPPRLGPAVSRRHPVRHTLSRGCPRACGVCG